jgi:hypothetical protein
MANTRSKIDKHNLGGLVARLRDQGRTNAEIHEALTTHLAGKDTISLRSVDTYVRTLPATTVAVIHDPDTTIEVREQVSGFADQFAKLNRITNDWLDEAEKARMFGVNDHGTVDLGPDWNARTKVAKELREQLKLMGDTMERIYNAEQVKLFQDSVLETISEVSPEVAQAIRNKLRSKTEIRKAALLGV